MSGSPTDPSAELVKLREPEPVGLVDDDGVDVGDVQSALDDGGADEDVEPALVEVQHHFFQLPGRHLPVADADAGLRRQFL